MVEAAKSAAKTEREEFSGLKSATLRGGELSGGDAQGRPLWKLSAKTIRAAGGLLNGSANNALKTATLTTASATLYRAGKAESTLQAPQIVLFYLPQGVRLQLSKGVKGTTEGTWAGQRGAVHIAAPRADVDVKKQLLSASGGVTMTQGALKITAQTLHTQTSLQSAQLQGKVRATSAQGGQIEAKSALYNWKTNQVSARSVSALREGTRLSGDVLNADTDATKGVLTGHVVARSAQGEASAPRLDFNWKRDQISAREAIFHSSQGTLRAGNLVTDSKLRLSSAQNLVAQSDGAILHAASATGFNGLSQLDARGLDFQRADLRFTAPSGQARKIGSKWVLQAQNGARGANAQGQISAPRVTWDENRARVDASGGVSLKKDGATLQGQNLSSDTQFQNATLTGQVRGVMKDGSVLTAQTLEKRGDKLLARRGATAQLKTSGSLGVLFLHGAQIEAPADGSSAVASGGVTFKSATGATARAPRATYNRARNLVIATGGVDFFDPARGLRTHGDTLIYDLKTNQATLSDTRGQGSLKLFEGKKLF